MPVDRFHSLRAGLAAAALGLVLVLGLAPAGQAGTIDTLAKQAILIDASTGTVLFEKNADQRMPTSSMSKILTMYLVFDALKSGRIKMTDTMPVSERAWRMQGSKMFVELHNQIKVEDLIQGVIIQSGNDACIVLAEGLNGSEEAFARAMNAKAAELGLHNSNFMNSTGWPHDNHYSTARDLSILAQRMIKDFPEYYRYYSQRTFTYHNIPQGNRNPLLYRNIGVDGMKTGHTEAAGYGLTASAQRDGRRLILVVNGLDSMQKRADEAAKLIEWGFREFELYALFDAGEVVEEAPVWMGIQPTVPLVVDGGLNVTMAPPERKSLKVTMVLDVPVPAPVAQGQALGKLVLTGPGFITREVPLVAKVPVERLNLFGRVTTAAGHILFGWL